MSNKSNFHYQINKLKLNEFIWWLTNTHLTSLRTRIVWTVSLFDLVFVFIWSKTEQSVHDQPFSEWKSNKLPSRSSRIHLTSLHKPWITDSKIATIIFSRQRTIQQQDKYSLKIEIVAKITSTQFHEFILRKELIAVISVFSLRLCVGQFWHVIIDVVFALYWLTLGNGYAMAYGRAMVYLTTMVFAPTNIHSHGLVDLRVVSWNVIERIKCYKFCTSHHVTLINCVSCFTWWLPLSCWLIINL